MKKIITRILATIGGLVVLGALVGWVGAFIERQQALQLPDKFMVVMDLSGGVAEATTPPPLPFIGGGSAPAAADIVRALDRARRDGRVAGLVVRFGDAEPSMAAAAEIRDAFNRFAASGKITLAYAQSFGELTPANKNYFMASALQQIWLQPGGVLGITGISIELPYFRALLDKFGVQPEFITRKGYKTAMANLTEKNITPADREQLNALLDGLYNQLVSGIASGRNLPAANVRAAIDSAPLLASEALQQKLVDKLAYENEVIDYLKSQLGLAADLPPADLADYIIPLGRYAAITSQRPVREIPDAAPAHQSVAYIEITGVIHSGTSQFNPLYGFESAGADTIVDAITSAIHDENIKALVVRIDSPGGSATASESIRHALARAVAKGKPVIISMGAVAASGGYWAALGGSHIIASPATITGSIGVLAGKVNAQNLAAQYDIGITTLQRGANANMFSLLQPFSTAERTRLNVHLDAIYEDFISKVATARGLDKSTADKLAGGRVWLGTAAFENKLVDELGGLDVAFKTAKEKIGIAPDVPVPVVVLPAPPSMAEQLFSIVDLLLNSGVMLNQLGTVLQPYAPALDSLAPRGLLQADVVGL